MPVFSVDTEHEAKMLMAMLPLGYDGKKYANELFGNDGQPLEGDARIDGFVRFGLRLQHLTSNPPAEWTEAEATIDATYWLDGPAGFRT